MTTGTRRTQKSTKLYLLRKEIMDNERKAEIGRALTYRSDTSIHGYSYKPDFYFVGGDRMLRSWTSPHKVESKFIEYQGIPMGFELELERRPDARYEIDDTIYELVKGVGSRYYLDRLDTYTNDVTQSIDGIVPQLLWAKSDGSLNNGVEFVTQPMTLEVHKGVRYEFDLWNDLFQGYHRSTTGMHIHIPKGAFSNVQLYLWIYLMQMIGSVRVNHAKWDTMLTLIGQRRMNNWARFQLPTWNNVKHQIAQVAIERIDEERARYKYVNYNNRSTLELRFFKANMLKERILKNLEFVASTYDYVRAIDSDYQDPVTKLLKATNFKDYWRFIENRNDEYEHLHQYLTPYIRRLIDWNFDTLDLPVNDEDTEALRNLQNDQEQELV